MIIHGFPQLLMRIIWQKSVDTAERIACVQTSPISLRLHAGNRKERLHIRKLAKFESDTFAFAKVRCFAGLASPPPRHYRNFCKISPLRGALLS